MPHTVRFPVCARKPQARPQTVRSDGAVNNGAKDESNPSREAETGSVASGTFAAFTTRCVTW